MPQAIQHRVIEWSYQSNHIYADPFHDVQLDVLLTAPDGTEQLVPAFWAGAQLWRVRFSGRQVGRYHFVTRCSDQENAELHNQEGELDVLPYVAQYPQNGPEKGGTSPGLPPLLSIIAHPNTSLENTIGEHALYKHGPVQVAADRRHFEHADGTPFFWLADTWWMSLCQRLHWPDEFQALLADRVAKGFTVIQLIAGLYPDMPAFDPRGANEAGYPWTHDYQQINPEYFDYADRRIAALAEAGIVPCIVACWGYFAQWMGRERLQEHWRYLIARYGAYPVVWCLAGETTMPYYLSTDPAGDKVQLKQIWTELAAYVRATDPYHHPLTTHAPGMAGSRESLEDPSLIDFDFLQTGHSDQESVPPTIELIRGAYEATPPIPVIDGEVCYEGIMEASRQEIQRFYFWACMLSGTAGHSYGANGIWQVNRREQPFGPSPHGTSYGNISWDEAAQFPGSRQIGLGKRLLERYQWWKFEPHPEWCSPHAEPGNYFQPYAAGIPGQVRMIYFPQKLLFRWGAFDFVITGLEAGVTYRTYFWSPINGQEYPRESAQADADGNWTVPFLKILQDWVLVMEAQPAA